MENVQKRAVCNLAKHELNQCFFNHDFMAGNGYVPPFYYDKEKNEVSVFCKGCDWAFPQQGSEDRNFRMVMRKEQFQNEIFGAIIREKEMRFSSGSRDMVIPVADTDYDSIEMVPERQKHIIEEKQKELMLKSGINKVALDAGDIDMGFRTFNSNIKFLVDEVYERIEGYEKSYAEKYCRKQESEAEKTDWKSEFHQFDDRNVGMDIV